MVANQFDQLPFISNASLLVEYFNLGSRTPGVDVNRTFFYEQFGFRTYAY